MSLALKGKRPLNAMYDLNIPFNPFTSSGFFYLDFLERPISNRRVFNYLFYFILFL